MNWWRAHHGIANDPKLALISMSRHVTPCHARRGDVLAVWISLLDFASQNEPRGSIKGHDCEQFAWFLELPVETVAAIIEGFQERGMISGTMLTAWERRQPKRDREDLGATDRKRKQREKSMDTGHAQVQPTCAGGARETRDDDSNSTPAQVLPMSENGNVTPCHATSRTDREIEEIEKNDRSTVVRGFTDFPKTADAVCARFPSADLVLVARIVEASARAFLSIESPMISEPTDEVYAEAVSIAAGTSKKQTSPALFLKTVPNVVANWAKHGKGIKDGSPPTPIDQSKIIPYDPFGLHKKWQAEGRETA